MGRERKKAKKRVSQDRALKTYDKIKIVGNSQPSVLGLNVYATIIDEVYFVTPRAFGPYCDYEIKVELMKHDNEMLALAEMCASPKEVMAIATSHAEFFLSDVKKMVYTVKEARDYITCRLLDHLNTCHFARFQKKRMIDKIVKRKLRGYKAWFHFVDLAAQRLVEEDGRDNYFRTIEGARIEVVRDMLRTPK